MQLTSSMTSFSKMRMKMKTIKVTRDHYRLCFIFSRLRDMIPKNLWTKLN